MPDPIHGRDRRRGDDAWLGGLAIATLLLHFATNGGYGYFRDEFYYIACGNHLAWGYVDQPPLIALVAAVSRASMGDSLFALRFFPALTHAILVGVAGLMARALCGGRFAQVLTALATLVAPVYLSGGTLLTMNAFDQLFWSLCAFALIAVLGAAPQRRWLWFGLAAGAALMNKDAIVFFLFAILAGLLLTPSRQVLRTRWPWLAALVALLVFLPNLVWQFRHGWPTLEFLRNAAEHKNAALSPPVYLFTQVLLVQPLAAPLWIAGLWFFLRSPHGARWRALGWSYLVVLALFLALKAKDYYLAPIYPMLLAGGAVAFEKWLVRPSRRWIGTAYAALLLAGGAALAPFVLPVLPVETFMRYAKALHIKVPQSERHRPAKLPQTYADMFGWEEMVGAVARVYEALPPAERARCAIFASNYGEAGAIDFFGRRYGLPKASSGHNSYWLWGPVNPTADIVITVGESLEDVSKSFLDVQQVAVFSHEYNMPYESDLPICIGRGSRLSWQEIWLQTKKYI